MLILFIVVSPPQENNKPAKKAGKKSTSSIIRYMYNDGYFQKYNNWIQYKDKKSFAEFIELRKDKEYIYIGDTTRTKELEPKNILTVRLPIKGGAAHWSWTTPIHWYFLFVVTPVKVPHEKTH